MFVSTACFDQVLEKCTELLAAVPEGFTEAAYLESIAAQGGLGVPLNIFLMQEAQRLQLVIVNVGGVLKVSPLRATARNVDTHTLVCICTPSRAPAAVEEGQEGNIECVKFIRAGRRD